MKAMTLNGASELQCIVSLFYLDVCILTEAKNNFFINEHKRKVFHTNVSTFTVVLELLGLKSNTTLLT